MPKEQETQKSNVPATLDTPFVFTPTQAQRALKALAAASGRDTLNIFDLEQWRIPGGGARVWDVENHRDAEYLDGVILHHHEARNYWATPFGDGSPPRPPDCASTDGVEGLGNPGGTCSACPLYFGACKNVHRLYVLPVDSVLPVHLSAPSLSIKPVREYLRKLGRSGYFPYQVITRFRLRQEIRNNQKVAVIVPEMVGVLKDAVVSTFETFLLDMKSAIAQRPALTAAAPKQPLFTEVDEEDDDIVEPEVPSGVTN